MILGPGVLQVCCNQDSGIRKPGVTAHKYGDKKLNKEMK